MCYLYSVLFAILCSIVVGSQVLTVWIILRKFRSSTP